MLDFIFNYCLALPLLAISYFAIVKGIVIFTLLIPSIPWGIYVVWAKRYDTPYHIARVNQLQMLFGIIIVVLTYFIILFYDLWTSQHLKVWQNPLILVILLMSYSVISTFYSSYNPIFRAGAKAIVYILIWPVVVVTLLGYSFPNIFSDRVITIAMHAGLIVAALDLVPAALKGPKRILEFEKAKERHDQLIDKLDTIQNKLAILGCSEDADAIRAIFRRASSLCMGATRSLTKGDIGITHCFITEAEVEASHTESYLSGILQDSIKEKMCTKLTGCTESIEGLERECEKHGIDTSIFDDIKSDITGLDTNITNIDTTATDIVQIIGPFQKLEDRVSDARIALRFKVNTSKMVDKLEEQLIRHKHRESLNNRFCEARDRGIERMGAFS